MNEVQVHNGLLEICIRTKAFANDEDGHTGQEIPDDNIHADLKHKGRRRLRERYAPLSYSVPGNVRQVVPQQQGCSARERLRESHTAPVACLRQSLQKSPVE